MNTKLVGIKEFRKDVTGIVRAGAATGQRVVVMHRNKPLFEVVPFGDDADVNDLLSSLIQAEQEAAAGETYTHDQVLAELSR